MAQTTTGVLSIFSQPSAYDLFQRALGARKLRRLYTERYLQPFPLAKVLDIGCGTSEILDYLPDTVVYVGYDFSAKYIDAARNRYGKRGEWHVAPVSDLDVKDHGTFDIVMANGIFHHLDDDDGMRLSSIAASALKPDGRFCTHDGCYVDGQNPIARYLLSKDRGSNIRDQQGYLSLVLPHFERVDLVIRHDMLRIPYTHAIMVGQCPRPE